MRIGLRWAVVATIAVVLTGCAAPAPDRPAGTGAPVQHSTVDNGLDAAGARADPAPAATPAVTSTGPARPDAAAPAPLAVEDFNGTTLDAARWQVYDALATNGISRWTPDNVRVAGGELRIAGQGNDPTGQGNASGGLCWCRGGGARTYGRWQIRARFEAGTGYGQAILLWPVSERWPDDGEIDIVETPSGAKRTADGTVHWGSSTQPREDGNRIAGDFTAWHVYTVDWRADAVRLYVDGQLYYDTSRSGAGPVVPRTPMSLALQQEPGPFGDNWVPAPGPTTPAQVVMHVDWIRVYA